MNPLFPLNEYIPDGEAHVSVTGYIYTAVTMPKTRTDSVCRITPSGRLPSQTFPLGAAKKKST